MISSCFIWTMGMILHFIPRFQCGLSTIHGMNFSLLCTIHLRLDQHQRVDVHRMFQSLQAHWCRRVVQTWAHVSKIESLVPVERCCGFHNIKQHASCIFSPNSSQTEFISHIVSSPWTYFHLSPCLQRKRKETEREEKTNTQSSSCKFTPYGSFASFSSLNTETMMLFEHRQQ